MSGLCKVSDYFGRWSYYPQHPPVWVGEGQIRLLNGSERFGRCSIAGQYNQVAPFVEQFLNTLPGILGHSLKRAVAIGRAGIITKINVIVLRESAHQFF